MDYFERISKNRPINYENLQEDLSFNVSKPNARLSARVGQPIGYSSKQWQIGIILDISDRRSYTNINTQLKKFIESIDFYCQENEFQPIYIRYHDGIKFSNQYEITCPSDFINNTTFDRQNLYDFALNQSDYQAILISDCQTTANYAQLASQITIWQIPAPRGYQRATTNYGIQIPIERPKTLFL